MSENRLTELEGCPNCGFIDYRYQPESEELLRLLSESVGTAIQFYSGHSLAAVGKVIAGGGTGFGIFSIPVEMFRFMIQDYRMNPVLICNQCRHAVICCPHCLHFMLLDRKPKTAELIACYWCREKFMHCFQSREFNALGLQP